jgi:AcrR family transcriptional regulator
VSAPNALIVKPRRMPRPEREAVILDAAEAVFGDRGYRATAMDSIAERSGVTKALLYQYFGSKESLYEGCVERARARLFDEIGSRVAESPPGPGQLEVFVRLFFDYLERNREASWLLYGEASRSAVDAMRERNAETVGGIFERAVAAAGRRADPEAIAVLSHALVGAGEQVARWWVQRRDVPKDRAVDRFLRLARGAIAEAFREMEPIRK